MTETDYFELKLREKENQKENGKCLKIKKI